MPPGEAAHFVSAAQRLLLRSVRHKAVTSHLLPTYARANLAFERGEGAWLIATDGERYLDFTSGVAVNALGHAHPHLVAALTEQAQKLWHVSNLYQIPGGRAGRRAAVRCELCRRGVLLQFRRRGDGMLDQDRAQISRRRTGGRSAIASSPSRARFTAAPWRRSPPADKRNTSTASARSVEGFDQVPFGDLEATKRAIDRRNRRDPDRADHGRGRRARRRAVVPARAARTVRPERPAADVRRGADRHGPHRRTVRLSARRRRARHHGARQGARRRLSGRRVSRDRRGGEGHDRRHPRLDLRRQSAGDERRQRRARRHARARLPRRRAAGRRCCSSNGSPKSRIAIRR